MSGTSVHDAVDRLERWIRHRPERLRERLAAVFSGSELLRTMQVGVVAGISFWLAGLVLPGDGLYAPIAAVVAIGAGRDRSLRRVGMMLGGLLVAVGVTETAVRVIGSGAWQMGVITALSLLTARLVFDGLLALSYAAFQSAVLVVTASGEGWLPSRLLEASIGVLVAYAVVLFLMPPDPATRMGERIDRLLAAAARNLDRASLALADGDVEEARLAVGGTMEIDSEMGALTEMRHTARSLASWSPWRRAAGVDATVERLESVAPLMRSTTTLVRLVARTLWTDDAPRPGGDGVASLADGVRSLPAVLGEEGDAPGVRFERLLGAAEAGARELSGTGRRTDEAVSVEMKGVAADIRELLGTPKHADHREDEPRQRSSGGRSSA